jgi:hypothetical protein
VELSASQPVDEPVLGPIALDDRRFRIIAVEPHGWSTMLIEDEAGRAFVAATATGRLVEIAAADVDAMLERRTYRPWQGDRRWSSLATLPLLSTARNRPPSTAQAGVLADLP